MVDSQIQTSTGNGNGTAKAGAHAGATMVKPTLSFAARAAALKGAKVPEWFTANLGMFSNAVTKVAEVHARLGGANTSEMNADVGAILDAAESYIAKVGRSTVRPDPIQWGHVCRVKDSARTSVPEDIRDGLLIVAVRDGAKATVLSKHGSLATVVEASYLNPIGAKVTPEEREALTAKLDKGK